MYLNLGPLVLRPCQVHPVNQPRVFRKAPGGASCSGSWPLPSPQLLETRTEEFSFEDFSRARFSPSVCFHRCRSSAFGSRKRKLLTYSLCLPQFGLPTQPSSQRADWPSGPKSAAPSKSDFGLLGQRFVDPARHLP